MAPYAFGFLDVSKQPEAAVAVLTTPSCRSTDKLGPAVGACSPTAVSCAAPSATLTSSTWRSTIRAQEDRVRHPAPMASSSASTAPCWRSSSPVMHQKLFDSLEDLQADLDACYTTTITSGPTWATA